jgi:hypothetical protein
LFLFHRTTTFYRKETFLATSPLMLSTHGLCHLIDVGVEKTTWERTQLG